MVLAPFVLPGETVRAETEPRGADLLRALRPEVVSPSPDRVDAPCPYFTRCGGCHYQHAGYDYQLRGKRDILRETLRRAGGIQAPEQIDVVHGPEWGYRNRAQFHFAGGEIGYMEAGSHRLCPVEQCPISSPGINRALAELRAMMRDARFPPFLRSLEVFTNEESVQLNVIAAQRRVARRFFDWCEERIAGAGQPALDYRAAGELFRVSGGSFFQVNRFLIERLVETALDGVAGETALDLYAGVGLFSLPLARRFREVTAVETGSGALADLELNAARAGLRIVAAQSRAEEFLAGRVQRPDFVLADPPRTGLGADTVREILRLGPPLVALVACDPATMARDLGPLAAGGYEIERLAMVDLFPQTCHLEAVARLRRR